MNYVYDAPVLEMSPLVGRHDAEEISDASSFFVQFSPRPFLSSQRVRVRFGEVLALQVGHQAWIEKYTQTNLR